MDIGAFILAISFVVIVSVEIISYLINSEITKTKTETVSKVLFIVVIITMFQLIVKILEIVKTI